jgi:acetoin utilization protein AcuB
MQVSMWMSEKPYCVTPEHRLDAVAAAMQQGSFRQAPVVDGEGRLIGIVTDRDLREHKGYLAATKVSAAMIEPALAVGPEDPIEHAAQLLLERKIGALPVVDRERRVIGIVTTSDMLRGFFHGIGGGQGAERIDLQFSAPGQGFAEAVRTIEAAGGIVLGLGTFEAGDNTSRRFFVRVVAGGADRAVEALRAGGFNVADRSPASHDRGSPRPLVAAPLPDR